MHVTQNLYYSVQIFDDYSLFLPVRDTVFKFFTRMDRCIVSHNDRLFLDGFAKRVKTGKHHSRVYGVLKHRGMQIILAIHKS